MKRFLVPLGRARRGAESASSESEAPGGSSEAQEPETEHPGPADVSMASAASEGGPLALDSGDGALAADYDPDRLLPPLHQDDVASLVRLKGRYSEADKERWIGKLRARQKKANDFAYPPCGTVLPETAKRRFHTRYMLEHAWLEYSISEDKCFCSLCVLFAHGKSAGRGGNQPVTRFTTSGFCRWKDQKSEFKLHEETLVHKEAMQDAMGWASQRRREASVLQTLQKEGAERESKVAQYLVKILRGIRYCLKQELPMRGHVGTGDLDDDFGPNIGNWNGLLGLIRFVDPTFKAVMDSLPKNGSYIGKQTMVEILQIQQKMILDQIIKMVKEEGLEVFAIMADESVDSSNTEQLVIVLRYVVTKGGKFSVYERFVGFTPLKQGQTGAIIASEIIQMVSQMGLDLGRCVAVTLDGASAMRGHISGARAHIQRLYPHIAYVHCLSHVGNLVANDVSDNRLAGLAISAAHKAAVFLSSPKRQARLSAIAQQLGFQETKKKLLLSIGGTRFVQRFQVIGRMVDAYEVTLYTLDFFSDEGDAKTRADAESCAAMLRRFDIFLAIHVLGSVSDKLAIFASGLQSVQLDLAGPTRRTAESPFDTFYRCLFTLLQEMRLR